MNTFFLGFFCILDGAKSILVHSSFKRYAIAPVFIYFFIFITGLFGFSPFIEQIREYAMGLLGSWETAAGIIGFLVQVLSWVLATVILLYLIYILATVIASPFNSILAEKALLKNGQIVDEKISLKLTLSRSFKMMWVGVIKAVVFLVIGLILFLISFIPGMFIPCTFCLFVIMAFDFFDYSFEIKLLNFNQRIQYVRENLLAVAGFAMALSLTMVIPIINFLLIPSAVVGAANLMAKLESAKG